MNLKGVLSHFAPNAMVHSPTLEKKKAEGILSRTFSQSETVQNYPFQKPGASAAENHAKR